MVPLTRYQHESATAADQSNTQTNLSQEWVNKFEAAGQSSTSLLIIIVLQLPKSLVMHWRQLRS
jgi:hypothetical protein